MKCPFCAEEIQAKAIACRFCGAVKTGDRWQMSDGSPIPMFGAARDIVDPQSMMQMTTPTVILFVACWWGFVLYARARRSAFAA